MSGGILDELREMTLAGDVHGRHALMWSGAEEIRKYLHSFRLENSSSDFVEGYVNDALARFLLTLDRMPFESGLRVLELGSNPYLFSLLLRRFHEYEITHTNFFGNDIYDTSPGAGSQVICNATESHQFHYTVLNMEMVEGPYCGGGFDVIVFAEILEHLVIDPLAVFPKLWASLKPGGLLVLTTPNATRLINFANMMVGSNIFDRYHPQNGVYGRHNREFTCEEVERLLLDSGFVLQSVTTEDRYNYDELPMAKDNYEAPGVLPYTRSELLKIMEAAGASLQNRGDNIYAVARRPS
jgi:SAM-dependent methyltransferase